MSGGLKKPGAELVSQNFEGSAITLHTNRAPDDAQRQSNLVVEPRGPRDG